MFHTEVAKWQQWFGLVFPYNTVDVYNILSVLTAAVNMGKELLLNQLLLTSGKILCVNGLSGRTKSSCASTTVSNQKNKAKIFVT